MKNFILGVLVTAGVLAAIGISAKEYVSKWYQTGEIRMDLGVIEKYYDEETPATCYVSKSGSASGISCVRAD